MDNRTMTDTNTQKLWIITVQRELEEPATFHMRQAEKPTKDEIRVAFENEGYCDDWKYVGRVSCCEVAT